MKQLTPAVNGKDHIAGNPSALIELIEYGDYECPHCGHAYPVIKHIQQFFGDKMKFVFRDFPLSKVHPHAFLAAVATEAAAVQEKFWEMHDVIFENQQLLDTENIFLLAKRIGLDMEQFQEDMQQNFSAEKVQRDFESGLRSGVNRTPTFFINGEKYNGGWEDGQLLNYLQSKFDTLLVQRYIDNREALS